MCEDLSWQLINPLPVDWHPHPDTPEKAWKQNGCFITSTPVHSEEKNNDSLWDCLLRKPSPLMSDLGAHSVTDSLPVYTVLSGAPLCMRTMACSSCIHLLPGWEPQEDGGGKAHSREPTVLRLYPVSWECLFGLRSRFSWCVSDASRGVLQFEFKSYTIV